jgi:hypothetical protein
LAREVSSKDQWVFCFWNLLHSICLNRYGISAF